MAVVEVLHNGRARDNTLALLVRNTWLICAMFNIHIVVLHIPGRNNVLADLPSRWQFSLKIMRLYSMDTYTYGSHIVKLFCIISFVDDMGRAAQLATSE